MRQAPVKRHPIAIFDGSRPSTTVITASLYETMADAEGAAIDAGVSTIQTLNYAVPGDGGGATYVRRGSEPAYPGKFQSADGAWWEIVAAEFNVKAFGAVGDGVTDDRQAIQDALDRAIRLEVASQGAFKVTLPPGHYSISAPLEILYFTPGAPGVFDYCTVTLGSDARGYVAGQKWTEIICTFNDRPAIICQNVRSVEIYGFALKGGANSGLLPTYTQLLNDLTAPWWNTLGGRDDQYSPHCGIAIDPFKSTVPVGNRYPGYDAYYAYTGTSSSSGIAIERMSFGRFIVGVGISVGTLQLGDNMSVSRCNFYANKVCIVQGQTQNRGNLFAHNHVQGCQVYVDCIRYGTSTAPLGTITGGTLTHVKWLILGSPTFDSGTIRDLYVESIWSLGCWGYYNGGHMLLVERCHVKFINSTTEGAADWHFFTQSPVTFYGGYIGFNNNGVNRMSVWNNSGARILFDGNIMLDGVPQFSFAERAEFRAVRVRFEQGGFTFGIGHYYNEALTTVGTVRTSAPPGTVVIENLTDRRWRSVSSWDLAIVQSAAVTVTVSAPGAASFTCNPIANSKYMQVGDELVTTSNWFGHHIESGVETNVQRTMAKMIIGRIESVNDTTGEVVLTRVPTSFVTGSYSGIRHDRMPLIHPITIATTTSGSNILTNINPVLVASTIWKFWSWGERISGTGIPANARVNAMDVGANTLTISHNATASGVTEIYDAKMVLEEGSATVIPTTGVWAHGTFMRNSAPSVDASNMVLRGWVCTVSGAPGTWEPQYTSAVSPAT